MGTSATYGDQRRQGELAGDARQRRKQRCGQQQRMEASDGNRREPTVPIKVLTAFLTEDQDYCRFDREVIARFTVQTVVRFHLFDQLIRINRWMKTGKGKIDGGSREDTTLIRLCFLRIAFQSRPLLGFGRPRRRL